MRITVINSHREVQPSPQEISELFLFEVDQSGLERWYEVRNVDGVVLAEFGADAGSPVLHLTVAALQALQGVRED